MTTSNLGPVFHRLATIAHNGLQKHPRSTTSI